ncbi:MAG: flavodoxin family protein [Sedimentisphaerales bacterium]|nr:flavodoxin family protein [Sedimentisphaerales bacterium]MBN2842397.1 flavodoxin family protein [Sedimentisphaerales bacterium]
MARKILFLNSSPRMSSNTNIVVEWVAETIAGSGFDVEIVDIAQIYSKVPGCLACMGCQMHKGYLCVIEDDVQKLLARIPEFDAVVFATPIYFFGPNAQLKRVLDRWLSLTKPDESGNAIFVKKDMVLGLISTAGGELSDGLGLANSSFISLANFVGLDYHSLLIPNCPYEAGAIHNDQAIMEKARSFAAELLASVPA